MQGRHVIGVYPILSDETCWFLAADFDKQNWQDDVRAFVATCRDAGVPYAIERSRSGNGAHVWFFFNAPVRAETARRMGSYLITRTMASRHQLTMASYDRLFPNQDTLPHGGFGNLIALPLQYHPRQQGNTVFLNETLEPHTDQWGFLRAIPHLALSEVERVAAEASARGQVIGVQVVDRDDDPNDDTPWLRSPSKESATTPLAAPVPSAVRASLSQRLYVARDELPSPRDT